MVYTMWTVFLFLSIASAAGLMPRQENGEPVACNNSPTLCSRSYSSITYLAAHDSPFWAEDSDRDASVNQHFNSVDQLSAGVRMLTGQIHEYNGTLNLCHTSCLLKNAGPVSDWLAEINDWLDKNPNEVITLLLVNSENKPAADLGREFEKSGITKYAYKPPSLNGPMQDWPTLRTMIKANTRVLTFINDVTDQAEVAPYLMSEFQFMFENHFAVTDITNFTCAAERPDAVVGDTTSAVAAGYLPVMNHFLDIQEAFGIQIPDEPNITTTNSPSTTEVGALGTSARRCQTEWGRIPAFVLVDFFEQGPALEAIDELNGLKESVGRVKLLRPAVVETSGIPKSQDPAANAALALFGLFVYMIAFM